MRIIAAIALCGLLASPALGNRPFMDKALKDLNLKQITAVGHWVGYELAAVKALVSSNIRSLDGFSDKQLQALNKAVDDAFEKAIETDDDKLGELLEHILDLREQRKQEGHSE